MPTTERRSILKTLVYLFIVDCIVLNYKSLEVKHTKVCDAEADGRLIVELLV